MKPDVALLALGLAAIAGSGDTLGAWCTTFRGVSMTRKGRVYATAAAAGFMIGVVLLDRMPELYAKGDGIASAAWLLSGFMLLYVVESYFNAGTGGHNHSDGGAIAPGISLAASYAAQGGLMVHTFFDGVAIGAGFATSPQLGALMFMAVVFHKVPEGFSVGSLVLAAGRSQSAATRSGPTLGVCTLLGAMVALLSSSQTAALPPLLMAVATGTFLYVATCSLLPATNLERDPKTVLFLTLGLIIYVASSTALNHFGLH